jgi:DNA-directed RNA polymerase beta subunit
MNIVLTVIQARNQLLIAKPDSQLRFELLLAYFEKLAKTLPHYVHTAHTNGNESVNNMFTLTASKRKDYKATYKGRVDVQILRKNIGEEAVAWVLEALGIELHKTCYKMIHKLQEQQDWHKKRKQTAARKAKRRAEKEANAYLHSGVEHPHTYKNLQGEHSKKRKRQMKPASSKKAKTSENTEKPKRKQ